jgi:hypothetical protein
MIRTNVWMKLLTSVLLMASPPSLSRQIECR